jgi:SAM-dependent methyltransferase
MNTKLRRVARRLPEPVQAALRRTYAKPAVRRSIRRIRFGSLRRLQPVSQGWGSERGTPVDRIYIDRFFAEHAPSIHGRVLEVRDPRYTNAHGQGVDRVEIVDIDPRNTLATIVADLADPGSLPAAAFDCAIVPQTLVYVRDLVSAVANLWQSLVPGGTLLITTPAIARIDPAAPSEDRWHLTPAGLAEVVGVACPSGDATITGHGNPLVAVAFLHGLAQEDLSAEELEFDHPLFPIVVTAVVRKPG